MERVKRVAIVGMGLSGCTVARLLAERGGYKVECYEAGDEVGGLCSDEFSDHGYYQKFGPHILHTDDIDVYNFLSRFGDLSNRMEHRVGIIPEHTTPIVVPYPISEETYDKLGVLGIDIESAMVTPRNFEEACCKRFGRLMYEKVIKVNTERSWYPLKPADLPVEVANRVCMSNDRLLFDDNQYVVVPYDGWSRLLRSMVDHPAIDIRYNCSVSREYIEQSLLGSYEIVVVTSPVSYSHDNFIYRKFKEVDLVPEVRTSGRDVCINNSSSKFSFTRFTNYGRFPVRDFGRSRYGMEHPAIKGEEGSVMCYPNFGKNGDVVGQAIRDQIAEVGRRKGTAVAFTGRLGLNAYMNMDLAVRCAMKVSELVEEMSRMLERRRRETWNDYKC